MPIKAEKGPSSRSLSVEEALSMVVKAARTATVTQASPRMAQSPEARLVTPSSSMKSVETRPQTATIRKAVASDRAAATKMKVTTSESASSTMMIEIGAAVVTRTSVETEAKWIAIATDREA